MCLGGSNFFFCAFLVSLSVYFYYLSFLTRKRGFSFRTNFTHKANNLFRDKTHNTHTHTHTLNNNNNNTTTTMMMQSRVSTHYASTSSSSSSRRAPCPPASSKLFAFRRQQPSSFHQTRRNAKQQQQKRSGSLSVVVKAGLVEKMNAEQLEVAMADRSTPLVIDFYATWCGPCVLMSAELEKVKEQLGEAVRCIKVDTDEETELATQLGIEGLPTIVFVSKDAASPALRTEGMIPAETVISIIENQLQG